MTGRTIGHHGMDEFRESSRFCEITKQIKEAPREDPEVQYRMLDRSDVLKLGDEFLYFGEWIPTTAVGRPAVQDFHRRPVIDGVE